MAAEQHNPTFDVYRNNLAFMLHLSHVMQANQQRMQQCKGQAAERAAESTAKIAEAVASAKDWTALSTLSTTLVRQQTELAAAFWQDFFGVLGHNREALQTGLREAVEDLQAVSPVTFPSMGASFPQSTVFEDMLKPFEPFTQAVAAAYNMPAQSAAAKRGANHAA